MSGAKDSSLINGNDGRAKFYINGKGVYARILIKKKDDLTPIPAQFEILGLAADKRDENPLWIKGKETYLDEKHKKFVGMVLNGKATYARIIIKKLS